MTNLNIQLFDSFNAVKYIRPETDTEEVLYNLLKDEVYFKEETEEELNEKISNLEDEIEDLESKLDAKDVYVEFFEYIRGVFEDVDKSYPRFEADSDTLIVEIEALIRKGANNDSERIKAVA